MFTFFMVTNETMEFIYISNGVSIELNHPEVDGIGIWDFQAHSHFGEVETSTF